MKQDQWVLLWSQRQNALHVETLDRHLQANLRACGDDQAGDYRLLVIGSRAEVDSAAERIRRGLFGRRKAAA